MPEFALMHWTFIECETKEIVATVPLSGLLQSLCIEKMSILCAMLLKTFCSVYAIQPCLEHMAYTCKNTFQDTYVCSVEYLWCR